MRDLPKLIYNRSAFNRRLIERVSQLRRPYVPTPWLRNRHLQLLWLVLCEIFAPPPRYDRRETLRMRDGGTTALYWSGDDCAPATPTLVVLPSITGDAHSTHATVDELRAMTGWRVVVCARRGHRDLELTAPVVNTMGCTKDFREQLRRIRAQVPQSPLFALGISAGSAVLVRYLGESGKSSLIRAGVAFCPGYDISVAWKRVPGFYSRAMALRLKRYFLHPHSAVLRSHGAYDACLAARDLAEFHERFHALAGCKTSAAFIRRSNPVLVMDKVSVPMLIINADDDPLCVVENTLEHEDAVREIRDALLVRTARGSHCAFFEGWRPRSWANRLIAGYVQAAADLLPKASVRPATAGQRLAA